MKNILWSNLNIEVTAEDRIFFKSEYPEIYNAGEEAMHTALVEENETVYLDTLKSDLSSISTNQILVIADIGLWTGRTQGYKIIDSLSDILSTTCGDYVEFYYDKYNIRCEDYHHDGTNYYIYREIREERNIDNLLQKIYEGKKISSSILNYYTKSLNPYIYKLYGKPIKKIG